ncbi:MAG: transglutaminase [Actinomycetota bacterium]|jgi:transglutaminase-like putative cysteine protease|nr:MAG: transglutaminase [Actinomycetota bacterium]
MARPASGLARLERLSSLGAVGLVGVGAALALGRVIAGAATTRWLLVAALASAGIAWALERRGLLVAGLASAAGLVVVAGLASAHETTAYGLPTAETLRSLARAVGAVGEQARAQAAPAPPVDALVVATLIAVWAATFSCHALFARSSSPLLALIPPLCLLAFPDTVLEEELRPGFGIAMLPGVLAIVLADGWHRLRGWGPTWGGGGGREGRLGPAVVRGARGLGLAAIATAVLAPTVVPGFGSAGLVDVSRIAASDRLSVDPLVSVAAELNRSEPLEVFRVRTTAPSYWRMLTLDAFDGVTWRQSEQVGPSPLVPGAPLIAIPDAARIEQTFRITNDLGYPWLAVAPEPLFVRIDRDGTWDPVSATIAVEQPLEEGQVYRATSSIVAPDVEQLAAASVGADPRYLRLPPDLPEEIAEIARAWVREAGARTPFEQVMAIQQRLRGFTYSTDVAWRDDAASLVRFLTETRTGFCQQFASAMAVMLRTLGIPARVAVGFGPGRAAEEPDTYTVTTDDLHSWVEVPFPAYGWLAFEPTPGRTNPGAAWQAPSIDGRTCGPRSICTDPGRRGTAGREDLAARSGPRADVAARERGLGTALPVAGARRSVLFALALALALALAAALAPARRALARRRRLRRAGRDPRRLVLATYEGFAEAAADLGAGRRPGETPLEYRRRIEATVPLEAERLLRLTTLVERAAFAPAPPTSEEALDARADADEALRALRRATPRLRRLVGPYVPR